MNAIGAASVLASGVQAGHARATDTVLVALVIAGLALVGGGLVFFFQRRPRRPRTVTDQWGALAVMGELCPHGWDAQISLYGRGAPMPDDAPPARVPLVALEWKEYDEEPGRVVVARRVWAPTIDQALQSMVDDRRTDIALEQIERAADSDGELGWGD
jgi:LPXTG-motif cell wall-anchored protein